MLKIWIDGACRPNPGKGGIGIVIRGDGWDYTISEPLDGKVSNNQAEYGALTHALIELLANGCADKEILIHSDSQMLVEQMSGNRGVDKGGKYVEAYQEAMQLDKLFTNLMYVWIGREQNAEANLLASQGTKKTP